MIAGPALSQNSMQFNKFGLYFVANGNVTLISVRFPNRGQADTIVLRQGVNGTILASVPTMAGAPDAVVTFNQPLAFGQDYAIYSTTLDNTKVATALNILPFGTAELSIQDNVGCVANPACTIQRRNDTSFWFAFNDITTTDNLCGNGTLDLGEGCDDGDREGGDCCLASCQLEAPPCLAAEKSKLSITDSVKPGKDKLLWQWVKGAGFGQTALGNPSQVGGTSYSLCVFDQIAAVTRLVQSIDIAPSALWISKDPKGFKYKDKLGSSDGVTNVLLKTGIAGKTKVKLKAATSNLTLPAPVGSTFFHQDPDVIVRLVGSNGTCWSSSFHSSGTKKNVPEAFKASAP